MTHAPLSLTTGFCGAPILPLDHAVTAGQPGDVVLFGLDQGIGRRFGDDNPGAASFVRHHTATMGGGWTTAAVDVGLIEETGALESLEAVAAVAERVAAAGQRPVLVACDHSASLPAVIGTARGSGTRPVYVYFDAHFDLGWWGDTDPEFHNGTFVSYLLDSPLVTEVVNLGGRSAATHLAEHLDRPRFRCIRTSRRTDLPKILAALAPLRGCDIHVSIDADVLSPITAPHVCCPEPGGIEVDTLLALCRWLGLHCRVVGADLTELMPTARSEPVARSLMFCIQALF